MVFCVYTTCCVLCIYMVVGFPLDYLIAYFAAVCIRLFGLIVLFCRSC